MNDLAITRAAPGDLQRLLEVRESSLRATQDFLPEGMVVP
jgi:hypothetical protein